ncbi:hypothetical protein [Enterobacter hormaechei]
MWACLDCAELHVRSSKDYDLVQ